jgi:hypothetical protein
VLKVKEGGGGGEGSVLDYGFVVFDHFEEAVGRLCEFVGWIEKGEMELKVCML